MKNNIFYWYCGQWYKSLNVEYITKVGCFMQEMFVVVVYNGTFYNWEMNKDNIVCKWNIILK